MHKNAKNIVLRMHTCMHIDTYIMCIYAAIKFAVSYKIVKKVIVIHITKLMQYKIAFKSLQLMQSYFTLVIS